MSNSATESFYSAYIAAINARAPSLAAFVHDPVTHNGRRLSLASYKTLIDDSFAAAPDIAFRVDKLLATETQIAARIWFDGTVEGELLGVRPAEGGKRKVGFAENIFYQLREGKIDEVWSVVDVKAVEEQLRRK